MLALTELSYTDRYRVNIWIAFEKELSWEETE